MQIKLKNKNWRSCRLNPKLLKSLSDLIYFCNLSSHIRTRIPKQACNAGSIDFQIDITQLGDIQPPVNDIKLLLTYIIEFKGQNYS